MMEDQLRLVDLQDRDIGTIGKMEAHTEGKLHRAFSVFLVHGNKMLIQKRNKEKYHSGGKWANACCSHVRAGEKTEEAVHRRLREELGVDCELKEIGSFTYFSRYSENMAEYEYDHVFLGDYWGDVFPDPAEIEEYRWVTLEELEERALRAPDDFATWFMIAMPKVIGYVRAKE